MDVLHEIVYIKTYLQYKNNVQDIYNTKMTYKHLKYVQDLAFGRQSCLQRVRKFSVKVWHIPDSYSLVCGSNVQLEYLLCLMDYEIDKLRAKAPETKMGGNITYYSIPFEYEDGKSLLKVEGDFRLFRHESYSLGIGIDDENEEFFTKLGERMTELAYEQKSKCPKSFKGSDLELVNTTASGKYKNVYARIYTSKSGKVNCNLSERKEVNGVYKRKRLDLIELVDETFKGSCVLRIYRVYTGSSKTITLSVEEVMATDLTTKNSYFDEYEEIESSDENLNVTIVNILLTIIGAPANV